MKILGSLIFLLIPTCIGLASIGLLTGKLAIKDKKTGAIRPITGMFKVSLWSCAILCTALIPLFLLLLLFDPRTPK